MTTRPLGVTTLSRPLSGSALTRRRELQGMGFVLAHIPLAFLSRGNWEVPTGIALLALGWSLFQAIQPARQQLAVAGAAYLAALDVFNRMAWARVPWEFGKYASALVLLVVLIRAPQLRRPRSEVLAYLLLLLPGIFVAFQAIDSLSVLRNSLSFYMSGPIHLTFAVLCLTALPPGALDLRKVLEGLLAPAVLVLIRAVAGIAAVAGNIQFVTESNAELSGFFGPDQVSGILGLAGLVALLLAIDSDNPEPRWVYVGFAAGCVLEAILTFARGGVYNFVISLFIAVLFLARTRKVRTPLLAGLGALALIAFLALPRINAWTDNTLGARYAQFETSGRTTIMETDLDMFKSHPLFGVGVGISSLNRVPIFGRTMSSHTEYTRLLSEHGLFGAAAMLVLFGMAIAAFLEAPNAIARGWVSLWCFWAFLDMAHSAMRLAVIGFVFALGMLPWPKSEEAKQPTS